MSLNRMTILAPSTNFGIEVTVTRRTTSINEFGETVREITPTGTKAIWCELGYREYRTKTGRRLAETVEVHLLPDFDGLKPGEDYFTLNGENYRIVEYLGMSRMVGVVQYIVTREDK